MVRPCPSYPDSISIMGISIEAFDAAIAALQMQGTVVLIQQAWQPKRPWCCSRFFPTSKPSMRTWPALRLYLSECENAL